MIAWIEQFLSWQLDLTDGPGDSLNRLPNKYILLRTHRHVRIASKCMSYHHSVRACFQFYFLLITTRFERSIKMQFVRGSAMLHHFEAEIAAHTVCPINPNTA
jgi:hypothetical protein